MEQVDASRRPIRVPDERDGPAVGGPVDPPFGVAELEGAPVQGSRVPGSQVDDLDVRAVLIRILSTDVDGEIRDARPIGGPRRIRMARAGRPDATGQPA